MRKVTGIASRCCLIVLCEDKGPNDYVFSSPKTKSCLRETKKGFRTACRLAGIEGLIWKDLRATFGTSPGRSWLRCSHYRSAPRAFRCSRDDALRESS